MERSATPAEAAAIAAAVERFATDQPAPQAEAVTAMSPWTRAALLEGVGAKRTIEDLEGGMR
jgi:hypothetical protein